ncbi:hypothetical protein PEPS_05120 [Persicobacter psychrovividus]|uniref:TonB C-terminal domain-containing protein n=2 Tax=Persicobacter psychrovividus TaxID=387638 RepID=A0ABN6LA62_9BACT|nr:hypothetical protein PEPS_05120 [Persicobacter psychrovividus]
MHTLLSIHLTSQLFLFLGFTVFYFFMKGRKAGQWNRLFLLGTALGALLLPWLSQLNLFPSSSALEGASAIMLSPIEINTSYTKVVHQFNFLESAYMIGALVLMMFFAFRLVYFIVKLSKAKWEKRQGIIWVEGVRNLSVCSYFNLLIWSDDLKLSDQDRARIIEHEYGHIRQWHSLDRLLMDVLCVLWWFNPAVWLIKNALEEEHEYLADAYSLRNFPDHTAYAQLLARKTLEQLGWSIGHSFFNSKTLKRISMMKNPKKLSRLGLMFSLSLVAMFSLWACQSNEEAQLPNTVTDAKGITQNPDLSGEIYTIVEEQPMFNGGMPAFYNYIGEHLKYPEEAQKVGLEGRVFVQFVVTKSGEVTGVKIIKGVDPKKALSVKTELSKIDPNDIASMSVNKTDGKSVVHLTMKDGSTKTVEGSSLKAGNWTDTDLQKASDALSLEAKKVIQSSPNWSPGVDKGEPQNVRMILPISFKLGEETK